MRCRIGSGSSLTGRRTSAIMTHALPLGTVLLGGIAAAVELGRVMVRTLTLGAVPPDRHAAAVQVVPDRLQRDPDRKMNLGRS